MTMYKKEDLGNYRPVRPCAGEGHGADYLECHHMACAAQSGDQAQPARVYERWSCLTNLVSFCDRVTHLGDEEKAADVVIDKPLTSFLTKFSWKCWQPMAWTAALFMG